MVTNRLFAIGAILFSGQLVADQSRCFAAETRATTRLVRKNAILVVVRSQVAVDSPVIRLGDVATITSSDVELCDRLKELDLEDALSPGESVTINARQIEFRLRVAGVDGDRISVQGSGVRVTARSTSSAAKETEESLGGSLHPVQISNQGNAAILTSNMPPRLLNSKSNSTSSESLEYEMIQAAQACVLRKLPWRADSIEFRLVQSVAPEVKQAGSANGYEITANVRSSGPLIGRVQVQVVAEGRQKKTLDVPIVFDVRHFDQIVVSTRPLERGHVIVASDLHLDRHDVTDLIDYCSSTNELIGTTTKRTIRALTPLRTVDCEAESRQQSTVLIKRREHVRMTARIGTVVVETLGEAQQDGRLGESIRIRNLDSNTIVQGRVVKQGEVEVAF